MSRIPDARWRDPIGRAMAMLPIGIRDRLAHVQFVCGVDPIFAGIHRAVDTNDGRSYRNTPHCCYPYHLDAPADRRVTTIVLPEPEPAYIIVHELGHALDHTIGRKHMAAPVTEYARTNRDEAFAEAFVAWRYLYGDQDVANRDKATRSLFRELARA